jgi:hypothetical protein
MALFLIFLVIAILAIKLEHDYERAHESEKIPARRASRSHSFSSVTEVAAAADGRAITTSQTPSASSCCRRLTISRSRRRTRFRTTAAPIRREVTNPTRNFFPPGRCSVPSVSKLPRTVWPSLRTHSNSRASLSRRVAGSRYRPASASLFMRRRPDALSPALRFADYSEA